MSIEEIRALRTCEAVSSPFDIILTDTGQTFHVALAGTHRAIAPNGRRLGVYEGIMPTVVDVPSINEHGVGCGLRQASVEAKQ